MNNYYTLYNNSFTEKWHLVKHLGRRKGMYQCQLIGKFDSKKEANEYCKANRTDIYTPPAKPKHKIEWSEEDIETLKKYYAITSIREMLDMLPGKSERNIRSKAQRLGLYKRKT